MRRQHLVRASRRALIDVAGTAEDFTQIGETFDFVLDAVGKTTFLRRGKWLKPGEPSARMNAGDLRAGIDGKHRLEAAVDSYRRVEMATPLASA